MHGKIYHLATQGEKGLFSIVETEMHASSENPNRVVLLLGAAGPGKSSLVDAAANYIYGVSYDDGFRFKVTLEGETDESSVVTAYVLNFMPGSRINFTVTFVNVKGFGQDEERNMEVVASVRRILKDVTFQKQIGDITRICCVLPATGSKPSEDTTMYFCNLVLKSLAEDVAQISSIVLTSDDVLDSSGLEELLTEVEENMDGRGKNFRFYWSFKQTLHSDKATLEEKAKTAWDRTHLAMGQFFLELNMDALPLKMTVRTTIIEEEPDFKHIIMSLRKRVYEQLRYDKKTQQALTMKIGTAHFLSTVHTVPTL